MHRLAPLSLNLRLLFLRVADAAGYTRETRPRLEASTTDLAFAELSQRTRRIVIGEQNLLAVVSDLWQQVAQPIPARAPEGPLIRAGEFHTTAVAGVLAHELGHIDAYDRGDFRSGPAAEANADWFAGAVLARLGMRVLPATLLFERLGCLGVFCEHPTPDQRRIAAERGHAHETRQMQRRNRKGVAWLAAG